MKFHDFSVEHILDLGHSIQLAGAVYSGEGKLFLCLLPDEEADLPQEVLEMTADNWEEFLLQTDVLNVEALVQGENGKVVKAIVRKSQRQVAQSVSWQVYRRDKYACRYCGRDDLPLTVDHLVLWEEGGPSIPGNLLSACKKCNKTRGSIQYADWLSHPYYRRMSRNLDERVHRANAELVPTLAIIPRTAHKPGKRK